MATDVEMADAPEAGKAPAKEDSKVESDAPVLLDVLRSSRALITKAVEAREAKLLIGRVLRLTATVRSQLADEGLKTFLTEVLAEGSAARAFLLSVLSEEVLASIVPRASVRDSTWQS
jgi:26S proteasome regulatory subunit N3